MVIFVLVGSTDLWHLFTVDIVKCNMVLCQYFS
jgi:hypothetical protein